MQPLELIKQALHATIEKINGGEKPTSALEKTAKEFDLNPNYIQRVGESLNVALHYNHFKKASEKSSDFSIADIPSVTANVFGEKDKTVKQKIAEWFPSVPVDIDYNKLLTNPGFKKAADAIRATPEKNDSYDITFKGQYKKAADYMNALDKQIDELKTKKASHDAYLEGSFYNLVKGFKKEATSRTSFHEFETQVYSIHGDRSSEFVDLIYKEANLQEDRGEKDKDYLAFEPCKEAEYFDSFIRNVDEINKLAKEIDEAEALIAEERYRFKQAGVRLNPLAAAFEKAECEKLAEDLQEVLDKEAAVGAGAASGAAKGLVQNLMDKFNQTTIQGDGKSPAFKNTDMDNRDRVMILQELIMTDPILSKADPRKILQAYQQIMRLAPQLSKEKEVVRAKLREMLAGQALHPTDANQLVEANTNLMRQHQMLKSTSGGGDDKKK